MIFLLKENLRKNDFIARYGGEEFAIILSHTHLKEALIIGEHLRTKIEESTFLYNKDKEIHLTVSGGISIFKELSGVTTLALFSKGLIKHFTMQKSTSIR